ncbi:sulfite exporter TauE/SafE family protein [Candidatus Saccharibacteria bacterium]|jgi:cytochrome c-type biogenesis protein|nr:sulfite exporter TauE/SafE family protein [Candidatus Saccharibacteria bacterium]
MALLVLSFIAGVLTILAPCILPLLPIIIGGSIVESENDKKENKWLKPVIITASLAVSVIVFTIIIKATTLVLGVPTNFWKFASGFIVIILGLNFLFPEYWTKISAKLGLFKTSNQALGKAYQKKGIMGSILIGASLGPVFTSCSPTYALILATIIPASIFKGALYLSAYVLGLALTLLLVALVGQAFVDKLKWMADPNGLFKKVVGILFIIVGVSIMFGIDKKFETYLLDQGVYDPISNIEQSLK